MSVLHPARWWAARRDRLRGAVPRPGGRGEPGQGPGSEEPPPPAGRSLPQGPGSRGPCGLSGRSAGLWVTAVTLEPGQCCPSVLRSRSGRVPRRACRVTAVASSRRRPGCYGAPHNAQSDAPTPAARSPLVQDVTGAEAPGGPGRAFELPTRTLPYVPSGFRDPARCCHWGWGTCVCWGQGEVARVTLLAHARVGPVPPPLGTAVLERDTVVSMRDTVVSMRGRALGRHRAPGCVWGSGLLEGARCPRGSAPLGGSPGCGGRVWRPPASLPPHTHTGGPTRSEMGGAGDCGGFWSGKGLGLGLAPLGPVPPAGEWAERFGLDRLT